MVYLIINVVVGFGLVWFGVDNLLRFRDEVVSLICDGAEGSELKLMATQLTIAALTLWLGYNVLVHKIVFAAHLMS